MRKLLIAVLAVLTALAAVAVASAQNDPPAAELTVTLSPKKAGTKKKPRSTRLELSATNNRESKTTASRLEIFLPKSIKLDTTGLKTCDVDELNSAGDVAVCPKGSKAGTGTSKALLNPYATSPAEINFKVTSFVGGKNRLLFFLESPSPQVAQALVGKLTKVSGNKNYGSKLTIDIPENLQQPAPGTYSALLELKTSLALQSGKRKLIGVTDCPKAREQQFGLRITYVPNPTAPAVRTVTAVDGAPCSG